MSQNYYDYDPNEECECGAIGAYDVYGNFLCVECLMIYEEQDDATGFF